MSFKFGVDSSSRFLLERGRTDTQTHTKSQTPLITLPTHRLPLAWPVGRGYNVLQAACLSVCVTEMIAFDLDVWRGGHLDPLKVKVIGQSLS